MQEQMTDKQFDFIMKSVLQIVKDSESKEDAVEKLQRLIDENKG